MTASKVGTINPMDTRSRAYVDEDLNEVKAGSPEAAFVYARTDLDRIRSRREELGLSGDEAARVHRESTQKALVAAERRAAQAAAEVEDLRAAVKDEEKAAKAEAKSGSKPADAESEK